MGSVYIILYSIFAIWGKGVLGSVVEAKARKYFDGDDSETCLRFIGIISCGIARLPFILLWLSGDHQFAPLSATEGRIWKRIYQSRVGSALVGTKARHLDVVHVLLKRIFNIVLHINVGDYEADEYEKKLFYQSLYLNLKWFTSKSASFCNVSLLYTGAILNPNLSSCLCLTKKLDKALNHEVCPPRNDNFWLDFYVQQRPR